MLQFNAMNRNLQKASDRRDTGVFVTWVSEEKSLQLRQGRSELPDVVIIQFECALSVGTVAPHVQIEQVSKHSNRGEGRNDDLGGGGRSVHAESS